MLPSQATTAMPLGLASPVTVAVTVSAAASTTNTSPVALFATKSVAPSGDASRVFSVVSDVLRSFRTSTAHRALQTHAVRDRGIPVVRRRTRLRLHPREALHLPRYGTHAPGARLPKLDIHSKREMFGLIERERQGS